jgi:hypothetical protein
VTTTDSKGKVDQTTVTDVSRVKGYDPHKVGTQTLSAPVGFFGNVSVTFEVRVVPLESITVATPPTKIKYGQGEEIDAAGLTVRGTWEEIGEDSVPADKCTFSGYDKNTSGNQTITVSYEGKTADFTVNVLKLVALSLTSAPTKTKYVTGEKIDLGGLALTGTFMDGTNAVQMPVAVGAATIGGFDSSYVGRQKVTLTVAGSSVSYDVTVEDAGPEGGSIARAFSLSVDQLKDVSIGDAPAVMWFKFTATANTQYIHLRNDDSDNMVGLEIQLYDGNNNAVGGKDDWYGGVKAFSRSLTRGNVYYIKVAAKRTGWGGPFKIRFSPSAQ